MNKDLVFPPGSPIHDFKIDVEKAMVPMGPSYDEVTSAANYDSDFNYYIQHHKADVDKAQVDFLKVCDQELGTDWHTQEVHRMGLVGRILSDSKTDLYKTWHRFMCTDDENREWRQPFFAINYKNHIADAVCLNDISPLLTQHTRDRKLKNILNEK